LAYAADRGEEIIVAENGVAKARLITLPKLLVGAGRAVWWPSARQPVYIGAASFWETASKRRAGKLFYDGSARAAAQGAGLVELAIYAADAETSGELDWDHRDPFDRMPVAHCLERSLTLIAADAAYRGRGDIAVLMAL
jgi:PIN domain nuclease of toxin-antitoxin system